MDQTFTMANGDINEKRFFSGNFGWKIYWESSLAVSQKKYPIFSLKASYDKTNNEVEIKLIMLDKKKQKYQWQQISNRWKTSIESMKVLQSN